MDWIEGIAQGVAGGALLAVIAWAIRHRSGIARTVSALVRGSRRLRVSMSALVQIEHDGEFVLTAQGPHRPNELGPIGGVYKRLGDGVPTNLDFHPDERSDHPERRGDLQGDLRGTIPAYRLPQFLRWFRTGRGRESDALHRELQEELVDRELVSQIPPGVVPLQTELIRVCEEGPRAVRSGGHPVYRRHEVYRLRRGVDDMIALARTVDGLAIVTAEEIRAGRTRDGLHIGEQTMYLLQRKPAKGDRGF